MKSKKEEARQELMKPSLEQPGAVRVFCEALAAMAIRDAAWRAAEHLFSDHEGNEVDRLVLFRGSRELGGYCKGSVRRIIADEFLGILKQLNEIKPGKK